MRGFTLWKPGGHRALDPGGGFVLTNQLVNMVPGPRDSRRTLLAAAAAEFAARGFAGAGVDRIARRAGLNKAMIYYHFRDKHALYRGVLAELLGAVRDRIDQLAAAPDPPAAKLRALVSVLLEEGLARPHLPPMMLREIAEGGVHLGRPTLELMGGVLGAVRRILAEGAAAGVFRPSHPLLTYFSLMGPIALYLAGTPVRARISRAGIVDTSGTDPESFRRHLETMMLNALLASPPARRSRRNAPASRRPRTRPPSSRPRGRS